MHYDDAGLGLSVVADPGTFGGGELKIHEANSASAIPHTVLAAPAVALVASVVPNRPVRVAMRPYRPVDENLIIATLQDANGKLESIPFYVEEGRLVAEVPHFSLVQFNLFDSAAALGKWLADAAVDYWNGFLGVPVECASGNKSQHLALSIFDGGGILDVEATDGGSPTRVRLTLCNQRQYYMEYRVDGASGATGLLSPRSSSGIEVSVEGPRNAPLTVSASYGPTAQSITAVRILLSLVPAGDAVIGASTAARLLALAKSLNCFTSVSGLIEMLVCAKDDPAVGKVLGEYAWNVLREQGLIAVTVVQEFAKRVNAIFTVLASAALVERLVADWQVKPRDVHVSFVLTCPPAGPADPAKTWIETTLTPDGRLRSVMHLRDENGVPTSKIAAPQQVALFKAVRPPFAGGGPNQTFPSMVDTLRLEAGGTVVKDTKAIWFTPSATDVVAITTPGSSGAPVITGWIVDLNGLGRPITGSPAATLAGCY